MEPVRPSKIRLEASSHYQLRCPSCPATTKAIHPVVGSGLVPFGAFTRGIDTSPWLKVIDLSTYGEIFLNPGLLAMLQYAHERGVTLSVENGANLNYASPEVLEGLGMGFTVKLSWAPDFSPVTDEATLRAVAGAASRALRSWLGPQHA